MKPRLFLFVSFLCCFFLVKAQAEVDVSTATGQYIQYDNAANMVFIRGNAEIHTSTAIIKADQIHLNTKTQVGVAEGHAKVFSSTANVSADKITVTPESHFVHAEGDVHITQTSSTITGREAFYNWQASTGVIMGAQGLASPWSFSAKEMHQEGRGLFLMDDASLTSCDATPPHYAIHSRTAKMKAGDRMTMKNPKLGLDETPVFWLPVYTKSLKPKKYSLRIEPGTSGRDGFTNSTILGIPFSSHSYTKFKWDYLMYTGNGFGLEHAYFLPNVKGRFNSYYIRDTNPDPQPQERRYSIDWNHFQRFTKKLTLNAKFNFQSDQTFGNQFIGGSQGLVENQVRGIFSEAGFNYQFSKASLAADFKRRDRFDSTVSSRTFVGQVIFPALTYSTIPIQFKKVPFFTAFSASYINQTQDRSNPQETLRYQRSISSGIKINRDFRIHKTLTLTPSAGFDEYWKDRDLSQPDSEADYYQGKYNLGLSARRRFYRDHDVTLGYSYLVRLEPGGFQSDTSSDDHGVEQNILRATLDSAVGRSTRVRLSSGYDFRAAPESKPDYYQYTSARITPPTLDVQWEVKPKVNVSFRETYAVHDFVNNRPLKTPTNTAGDIQFGNLNGHEFFSQGFTYTKKTQSDADSVLGLNNKIKFFLSPRWYVDLMIGYQAVGPQKMDYRKVHFSEKTMSVVRDLHCWLLRMQFSSRTGVNEASFYIDLKTNLNQRKDLFAQEKGNVNSPYHDPDEHLGNVFPSPNEHPDGK